MDNIITRFFNRNKKRKNASSNIKTSNTEEFLSLTKFVERHPKLNYSDVKKWFIIKKYIVKKKRENSTDDYFFTTNIGKEVGVKTSNYKDSLNVNKVGIRLNSNAQKVILDHFENLDISPVPIDLSINHPYFDTILSKIDPNIKLDKEQREVVTSKDKNTLVVAGAGAGKTTTMAAKVKYLVERQAVKPEEIIIVSYTNKAINELRERINDKLEIPVNIATFHTFAFDIVKKLYDTAPEILYSSYKYIQDYLEKVVYDDAELLSKLILFLGYYFDLPENITNFKTLNEYIDYKSTQEFETLKSNLDQYTKQVSEQRQQAKKSLNGEFLRSIQEVQIANFLYLNSIDYEYEKVYPVRNPNTNKPYTPDFFIKQGELEVYLEHFGISEDFKHSLYSDDQLQRYINGIHLKRKIHITNNTKLIETYSQYNDSRELTDHLESLLKQNGFTLRKRDDKEVYQRIVQTGKDKYIQKFTYFLKEFVELYKTNGTIQNSFKQLREKTNNYRNLLFLDIAEGAYNYYQEQLSLYNKIDFADMINQANQLFISKNANLKLPYKHIIIDEFQDIARQRFDFTHLLAKNTNSYVTAVGDDWQSIFAFAGSDVSLFTKFIELMGEGREKKIINTYRNSQELIDIAGKFIQKNSNQIIKHLHSPKNNPTPIYVVEYDDKVKLMMSLAERTSDIIGQLYFENPDSRILILGRYNFDMNKLTQTNQFIESTDNKIVCKKYPYAKIDFLTVHSAKGLGYDEVILLNLIEGTFGFPSQIEKDPIMKLVLHEENSVPFAEERRLFYVALTRTKNRVFLMTPQNKPSRFVIELIKENNLKHSDNLKLSYQDKVRYRCPQCHSPLKLSSNNPLGIRLYICTNEPEMCSFMTNEPEIMRDIEKCPECETGYLIVKRKKDKDGFVLGCTNYKNEEVKCKGIKNIQ